MQALKRQYLADFEALASQVDLAVAALNARTTANPTLADNNHVPDSYQPKMTRAERRLRESVVSQD